ncbi:MAG: aminotransferase class I/II-fold pyridoxal phosphate-dependent enzyme [Bacteroidia bacterium]|nr:aminotransferase class I/II-fold pyridoxal phosphate-dependent enzyme [Bacteroidia bacterium]
MDQQAITLNGVIQKGNASVYELLSERGKNIFFPKLGILAQSAQAKGKDINATIGEAIEDNGHPMHLAELGQLVNLPDSLVFPYAPSFGKPDLRNSWKNFIYKKNPSLGETPISLSIATNGITHGLSISSYLFVDEGDTVIIPDLYWENYSLIFENNYLGKIETFPLFQNGGFNHLGLGKMLDHSKGKIILLLNFPNNPTGYTPLVSEIEGIVELISKQANKGKKVVVLIDDAYFGLVYEKGVFKESIFTQLSTLHENVLAVKLDGATKEDYVWGFRVGFITYGVKNGTPALYEALENKTAGAVRGNISNISHLSQSLLQKAYASENYDKSKEEKFNILHSRYEKIKEVLADPKFNRYFSALPYNSGYFMCIELREGIKAEDVRKILLEKYSTGVIVFGNLIRIAFSAVPAEKINQLIENIHGACQDYLVSK